jgi:dihydroorotase
MDVTILPSAPFRDEPGPRQSGVTALVNARLVCPALVHDGPGGLVMENGVIVAAGPQFAAKAPDGARTIDCQGHLLCPGFIDMQAFTGEPGEEHRETLASASRAAAAGGVTTVICMPNTHPVIDDVALVDFIKRRARDTAVVNIHPMAAMTKGLQGKEMAEIGLLKAAGAAAFTNGKRSVQSAQTMRLLLTYARDFDALIVHHVEDPDLGACGVMNEGDVSARLGLSGVSATAETIMIERDVRLVALARGRYHAAAISCADSLEVVRKAKALGLSVTCGVTINHLTLNENDIGPYRTYFKVRPPLRREDDRQALVEGLRRGDIDVIVSSHDPQDVEEKRRPFAEAADGAIGLETLFSAALQLHHNGEVELTTLIRAMTLRPAEILKLPGGRLTPGAPADITLVDLNAPWRIDSKLFYSRCRNSPFDERVLQGRVLKTFVAGRCVYDYGSARAG